MNDPTLLPLLAGAGATVLGFDRAGRVRSVHGAWSATMPAPSPDGSPLTEIVGEDIAYAFARSVQLATEGTACAFDAELRVAGTAQLHHGVFTPLRDADGALTGASAVVFAVPVRRADTPVGGPRISGETARREEAIGRLVAGIAHEINNPLASILAFSGQLRAETRSAVDLAALDAIHSEALRSRAVVRDLIAYVRAAADAERIAVRFVPLVRDTVRSLEPHMASLGVALTIEDGPDDAWVEAEVPAIEQAVTNVVLNAAQAVEGAGRGAVRVKWNVTPDRCAVIVEDEGPGIGAEVLARAFDPFFTTKSPGKGTGLGLFVARGIVLRHGGTLRGGNTVPAPGDTVSRPDASHGAQFVLELPRAAAPAAVSGDSAPAGASAGRPRRVLIVDDEHFIRASIGRFFERKGWEVRDAADGAAAVEILEREGGGAFSLILCDLKMPGMGGIELYDVMAARFPEGLPSLVVATGDVVSRESADFVARTGCRVLEKPFELRTLGALAEELVARPTTSEG